MKLKKYENLKSQHPEYISLDQLRRICKISKRSARYLLENGIIPAIDTGQKTWRYKIAIDDVITYLRRREKRGSMIPPGAVSSRTSTKSRSVSNRKSFSQIVANGQEQELAEYFTYIYAEFDEVLTTADVVEMTGLNKSTITKLLKMGTIKSLPNLAAYLIPKTYLLEFVVSRRYLEARTSSPQFIKILGGFEIWKTAKLSQ